MVSNNSARITIKDAKRGVPGRSSDTLKIVMPMTLLCSVKA